jgi:hypothetical protein
MKQIKDKPQSLAIRKQPGQLSMPIPLSRNLGIEIGMALNGIVGDEKWGFRLFEDRRPSKAVMLRLSDRLQSLRQSTVAQASAEISDALSDIFSVMPSHGSDPVRRARVYLEELADLPAWAVAQVLRRFVRGDLGEGRFAPTIAEIRHHAARLDAQFARERERITKVLKFWGEADAGTPALKVVR